MNEQQPTAARAGQVSSSADSKRGSWGLRSIRLTLVVVLGLLTLGCGGDEEAAAPAAVDLASASALDSSALLGPSADRDHLDWPQPPEPLEVIEVDSDLLFAVNSSELSAGAADVLSEHAARLQGRSDVELVINGHTDSVGDASSNLSLSRDRANSVRDFFLSAGVDDELLRIAAFGESKLKVSPETTDEDRSRNRRVEIVVNPVSETS